MPSSTKKQQKERKLWFAKWLLDKEDKLQTWINSLPSKTQNKLNYSVESLLAIENMMLDTFDSSEIFKDKSNTYLIDCFGTYILETYRRNHCIELSWECDYRNLEYDTVVHFFPFLKSNYVNCSQGVNMRYIIHNRLGDRIFHLYQYAEQRFQEAKAANRTMDNIFAIEDKGHSYQSFIFNDSITFAKLRSTLNKYYKNKGATSTNNNKNHIIIKFKNSYHFHFSLDKSPSVLVESKELAEDFKAVSKRIENCKQRIEFWGDEDKNGDYFNESLDILEHLVQNLNMIAIYLKSGSILKKDA